MMGLFLVGHPNFILHIRLRFCSLISAHSQMYLEDMKSSGHTLIGGVFVEALPRDGLKEVEWVHKSTLDGFPQAIVARADLCSPTVEDLLLSLVKASSNGAPVRGIRQILNWEPTWPFVANGEVITSAAFEKGYE
jgi:hypothetical protein